jgi:hypothetical protein
MQDALHEVTASFSSRLAYDQREASRVWLSRLGTGLRRAVGRGSVAGDRSDSALASLLGRLDRLASLEADSDSLPRAPHMQRFFATLAGSGELRDRLWQRRPFVFGRGRGGKKTSWTSFYLRSCLLFIARVFSFLIQDLTAIISS